MPDAPETNPEQLQLIIDLAILQSKLVPKQAEVDQLLAERMGILQLLRHTEVDRTLIHQLTGIPMSTIYLHSGRPIGSRGRGKGK